MKNLNLGMTYARISQSFGISPLENTQYNSPEYPVMAHIVTDKYTVELYFEGVDENAISYGVAISRNK